MTTHDDTPTRDARDGATPTGTPPNSPPPKRARRRRRIFLLSGLAMAVFAGLASMRAFAHGFRGQGAFRRHLLGEEGEARMREHLKSHAARTLDRLDASDPQRRQIDAILDDVVPQLHRVMREGDALHGDAHAAFEAQDAAAVEVARKRGVALIDRGSKLATDALAQALAVLDDTQRAELERLHSEHDRGHRHWGGHRH